jgi:hypothetical protein
MVRGGDCASRLGSISRFEQTRSLNRAVEHSGTVAATEDETRGVGPFESAIVSLAAHKNIPGSCHNDWLLLSQHYVVK